MCETNKEKRPLILVTNDDGIYAKGLSALIEIVRSYGDVVVVAPQESQSGQSHAITVKVPTRLNKLKDEENMKVYTCSGTTVDCVKIALHQILDRKPDFLVSGINHGTNSSISVFYSGTMAGAIEGCLNGIPSVGFSLTNHSPDADFEAAKKYSSFIFDNVVKKGIPEGICLNVNIPSVLENEVKGIKVCRQTKGLWKESFVKRSDPFNQEYYWLTGDYQNHEEESTDTDEWALNNGYVSVVPVHTDLTAYSIIDEINDKLFSL